MADSSLPQAEIVHCVTHRFRSSIPVDSFESHPMIRTEMELSESLFRRLQTVLDRYPSISVSMLCAEAIGCYLQLLDTAEQAEQNAHLG